MNATRSVLLLCNPDRQQAANMRQHIRALTERSRHAVHAFNPVGQRSPRPLDLNDFDVVVVHYTIITTVEAFLPNWLADRIAQFDGLKVQLIQDEYRWIEAITAKIRELGIDVIFTLVPPSEVSKIYGARTPDTKTITTLAGFVPEELLTRRVPTLGARSVDVGYRGRTVPFWLGRLGQEKVAIGRQFLALAAGRSDLRCDIAWGENDRIYGDAWNEFLSSCRTTLGSESGASIADYDGSVERGVRDYLAANPAATFEEVEKAVLAPYEGNVELRVISPRQFEAAALRTGLVLFPGGYSGLLEPDRHYIPLERDFSNFENVLERLHDVTWLEEMVARTYEEVACSRLNSLSAFVGKFDDLIDHEAPERAARGTPRVPRRSLRPLVGKAIENRSYTVARNAAAVAMVARRRALRELAGAYATDPAARRQVGPGAVLDDLLKLALVTDLRGRSHKSSPIAIVSTYQEAERRLTIVSMHDPSPPAAPLDPQRLLGPLRSGELEIVWNHVAVGEYVPVTLPGNRTLPVYVGYHGISGAHSFRALRRLGTIMPERVLGALEPVLG